MAKTNANNQSVNGAKFNVSEGVYGIDAIPANAAVLLREVTVWDKSAGKRVPVTLFYAIEGVKSTKPKDIVMPVLAVCVAEAQRIAGFKTKFSIVKIKGIDKKTGIRESSVFTTTWLKSTHIHKSDASGNLGKGLELEGGRTLKKTALSVHPTDEICTTEDNDVLRVLMHKTAEAVCEQATMFKAIIESASRIFKVANEGAKTEAPLQTTTEEVAA